MGSKFPSDGFLLNLEMKEDECMVKQENIILKISYVKWIVLWKLNEFCCNNMPGLVLKGLKAHFVLKINIFR